MKLHLGCGEYHFEGYVNIDYPITEHTVQQKSVADVEADILSLKYPPDSVEEVRLHHVFEHFSRAHACALLASWNSWTKIGGRLHIEVPDFAKTARAVLSVLSGKQAKAVALRHLFGSQEDHWAVHYQGYTVNGLKNLVGRFGYKTRAISRARYLDTYNFELIAAKVSTLTKEKAKETAAEYLCDSMVADSQSEKVLLKKWLEDYDCQIDRSFSATE